jgi:hypothetical protein
MFEKFGEVKMKSSAFWNISDSSSSFLTFGWFIVWIEDLVVGIQS